MMKVVIVEAGKTARVAEIDGSLKGMQEIVGGLIQCLPYKDAVIVCNDEGKLLSLPLNRALYNEDGKIFDIIAGTFFICKDGEEDLESLDDSQIAFYKHMFYFPEIVSKGNGGLIVTPVGNMPVEMDINPFGDDDNKVRVMLNLGRYALTNGISLTAYNYDQNENVWEAFDDITTCLPISGHNSNEIFVADGNKNGVDWNKVLSDLGIISRRKGSARSGYNRYNRYEVNMNRLRFVCGDEQMENFNENVM